MVGTFSHNFNQKLLECMQMYVNFQEFADQLSASQVSYCNVL